MVDAQQPIAESPCPDKLSFRQRLSLHHQEVFEEHPGVTMVMIMLSSFHLSHIGFAEWVSAVPAWYISTFIFAPAIFNKKSAPPDAFSESDVDFSSIEMTPSTWSSMRSEFPSSAHCEDMNRYHPTVPINKSSPFYRGIK